MTRPFAFLRAAILTASLLVARSAAAADVQWLTEGPTPSIRVLGDPDTDWRIERSTDLVTWSVDHSLSTILAGDETNAPAKPVGDLSGRYLSDKPSNPRKWSFPQGTAIPAGGFLIVWLDEDSTATPGLHASFKLDKDGESLSFVDADTNLNLLLDSTTFGPLGADQAWARPAANPTHFQIQAPSPGAANP